MLKKLFCQPIMAAACFLLPESPRWLIVHKKGGKAFHNMQLLDFSRDELEEDLALQVSGVGRTPESLPQCS
jgi:hypothetical protein